MKHFIFSLMILAGVNAVLAQSKFGKATWGPELKEASKSTMTGIIAADDEGIYTLREKYGYFQFPKTIIESYDPKMNLRISKEIEMSYQGKEELDFEYVIYSNDKLYMFGSYFNSKLKTNYLFYQEWDKKAMVPKGALKKIGEVTSKSRYNRGGFSYDISKDKSKILLFDAAAFERDDTEKFAVTVYDGNMTEIWKSDIELPHKDRLFRINNYWVDNDGNFYLVGKVYKDKAAEKVKGEPNYSYAIVSYKDKGKTKSEATVSLGDYFITDLQVSPRNDGSVLCAGFYSDKGTYSIKGTYAMDIDPYSGKISNKSTKEFGKDFLSLFMSERKAEKGKELYEFDLDNIIMYDDGSATLVGEQYYVKSVTYTTTSANGGTSTTTKHYYHYDDIIAVHFDANNKEVWTSKIPKRQVTVNDGGHFSSYFSVYDDSKNIYFLFNDNPKNIFIKEGAKLSNYNGKESVINLLKLDAKGEWEKSILSKSEELDMITRPKVARLVSSNEAVIYAEWKKSYKLGRISFKI